MSRVLLFGLLLLLLVAESACGESLDARALRCENINSRVERCFGKGAPLFDCKRVSDADLDAADTLTDSAACELAGEVPFDGDPRSASCRLYGVDCVSPIQSAPEHGGAAFPVVLVNGIDTSPLFRWSTRIQDVLRAQGSRVFLATLGPYQPPVKRAPELAKKIDAVLAETGADKVNLVCHSLGGLDCRYYASPNGLAADRGLPVDAFAQKVASITTVGTAHRGTRAAEAALGMLASIEADDAANALASVLGDWFSAERLGEDADIRASFVALTPSNMKAFNEDVPDAEGVYYQSFAGFSRPDGGSTPAHDAKIQEACATEYGDGLELFVAHDRLALALAPLFPIVGSGETDIEAVLPNDGLVTIASTKWGTFRGCVPADHMEQLGQYKLPNVNVRTGVDIAWFYASIVTDLAGRGF